VRDDDDSNYDGRTNSATRTTSPKHDERTIQMEACDPVRINIEIPDDVHARLKMIASAEGKGFYEWLKDELVSTCPDESCLLEMLKGIRGNKRQ